MKYTPDDIYNYIIKNQLESSFLSSLVSYKQNFSIAEITDARFKARENNCRLFSTSYSLNIKIEDDEIIAALMTNMYVSAFISRFGDTYNVHFLTHPCTVDDKSLHEDKILQRVIRYMIMSTIVTLRLDDPAKVDAYIGR